MKFISPTCQCIMLLFGFALSFLEPAAIDAFRAAQEPLGQALLAARGETVHLAATLSLNRWGGNETAELRVLDLARPV